MMKFINDLKKLGFTVIMRKTTRNYEKLLLKRLTALAYFQKVYSYAEELILADSNLPAVTVTTGGQVSTKTVMQDCSNSV